MADRILKPDSGNDLVLQNDDASAKIEINEAGTIVHTGTSSIDVSGGTFTTSSAQKTAIVDGGKGNLTKSDVGLSNVTNDAQVPASGGTFTGDVGINCVPSGKFDVEGDVNSDLTTFFTSKTRTSDGTSDVSMEFVPAARGSSTNYFNKAWIKALAHTANGGRLAFYTRDSSNTEQERMRLDENGNLKFDSGYGSVATAFACRAWVNFNGTGTVAIRDSGNVSSITDLGTGDYQVNFTNAMVDDDYSAISSHSQFSQAADLVRSYSTTSVGVAVGWAGVSFYDSAEVSVAVFR